jgi:outer membrane protein
VKRHRHILSMAICALTLLPVQVLADNAESLKLRENVQTTDLGTSIEDSKVLLPAGAMGPVTLKTTLQKTKTLDLSLDQALQLAIGQNIVIAQAGMDWERKKLDYYTRLSDLLPDLTGEYRQSRFVGGTQIFGGQTVSVFRTTYQPQLTLNYTIYTAGQNIFEIQASKRRADAQRHMLEETRQHILTQVAIAYYELQRAYWQRAIALQSIKEAGKEVDLNRARYESGVGVKLDLLQAQSFEAARRSDLVQAENLISRATQNLIQLLNLDFDVDISPTSLDATTADLVPKGIAYPELVKLAVNTNPELKALQQLSAASKSDSRVALAYVFPKIDITAYAAGTGPQIDSLAKTRFAGIQASTNIRENMGVGNLVRLKAAKTLSKQAVLNVDQARRIIEQNIANSLSEMKTQEDTIQISKEALNYAKAAYDQAYGRLKEGVGTNIDLEAAMTQLITARSNLANAFLNYNQAQVSLLSGLGVVSIESLTQGYNPNGISTVKTP